MPAATAEEVDYRLPAGVEPASQTIDLKLDPSKSNYSGQTTINLTVERETDRIGINQVGLDMTSIVLSSGGKQRPLQATDGEWEISCWPMETKLRLATTF